MKKTTFLSLILIFASAKDGYSDPIIATETFVRDGLSTRVTNSELTTIITSALSTKADLQIGAVAGNVATMDVNGQYVDSGTLLSDLATTTSVNTSLAGKADLQAGAVVGNVATMNAAGQYTDSGTALSSLASTASVNTGLNTKLNLSGGTMTGAINMGNSKITNLATPTNTADATTKSYVDALHTAPSWATLSGQNWTVPGWGGAWQVSNGTSSVYGVAACLSTTTKSGNSPSQSTAGQFCWCKISNVNGVEASGAWVYNTSISNTNTCYSRCPYYCGYCVRYGSYDSCTRSGLLAAL